jgi:protein TonB
MKPLTILCILIIFSSILRAQTVTRKDSIVVKGDSTMKIEIESEFPGGPAGWYRFLNSSLVYPPKAFRKNIQGIVVAKFIVEKDGSLSNIEIVSGPKELWPAVLDVLNQSPKWHPATQNGKIVKSYKSQPISFKLEREK